MRYVASAAQSALHVNSLEHDVCHYFLQADSSSSRRDFLGFLGMLTGLSMASAAKADPYEVGFQASYSLPG